MARAGNTLSLGSCGRYQMTLNVHVTIRLVLGAAWEGSERIARMGLREQIEIVVALNSAK